MANYFAGLEYNKFSLMDLQKLESLVNNFWKAASVLLKDEILPALREIANAQISRVTCNELQQQILLSNSLVYKTDELAEILLSRKKVYAVRKIAVDGLYSAVTELHWRTLEDGDGTIKRTLEFLRTELCRVIRRVTNQRLSDFQKHGIEVEEKIPDDSRLVFGHMSDIYTIVNNLLENVITRAFEGVDDNQRKVASVRLEDDPDEEAVTLQILDSGRGIGPELKLGCGLSTVDEISRKICDSWHIEEVNEHPFRTKAWVKFFNIPKR